jgi:hypothetical protein
MYVSSFVRNALDELERGRSSREKLKKQSKLADILSEKLPAAIRGKIKKAINPKMDQGLKMHYVDLNISPKKDKTGYWVLAKGESEPLVTENLVEQKLRSVIQQIIKEELNKKSIDINGKTVRTYTQNGDKSYNVTYDDGTKDKIYVNDEGWDKINTLHMNATNSK